eukprot:scaffold1221_cov207-Amphora_coffeaeformis.AAC.37
MKYDIRRMTYYGTGDIHTAVHPPMSPWRNGPLFCGTLGSSTAPCHEGQDVRDYFNTMRRPNLPWRTSQRATQYFRLPL